MVASKSASLVAVTSKLDSMLILTGTEPTAKVMEPNLEEGTTVVYSWPPVDLIGFVATIFAFD